MPDGESAACCILCRMRKYLARSISPSIPEPSPCSNSRAVGLIHTLEPSTRYRSSSFVIAFPSGLHPQHFFLLRLILLSRHPKLAGDVHFVFAERLVVIRGSPRCHAWGLPRWRRTHRRS